MKALVTGATGFIGAHLTKYLTDKGYEVYALVRKNSKLDRLKKLNVYPKLIYGDITNLDSLKEAVREKDYVFHLAAVINANRWEDYYWINYQGTKNISIAIKKNNPNIKRFLYVSSIAASGPSIKGHLKNENDKCKPINNYGKTKLMGEEAVKEELKGLPYTIIRPPNVIGPGQQELLQSITTIESGIMPMLGNGDEQTSIIHVRDLVRAITLAAESNASIGKTYFITDGKQYSWRWLAKCIKEALKKHFVIPLNYPMLILIAFLISNISKIQGKASFVSPKRIIQIRKNYWTYDGSCFEKDLGFKAEVEICNGIKEAVKDYLQQRITRGKV